ncbi:unnamed protein product, partial [Alternaria alternata]
IDPNAAVQITRKGHVNRTNIWTQPTDPAKLNMEERTKVVDKHIQMLADKDPFYFVTRAFSHVRGIVNDLTIHGFVQTQEIPKVDRREAKHSLHLVWYDRQRAREKLLHDTYKAERSDVVGNEEKWLSTRELDDLRKWKEVQEKLLLQLMREDDLVAALRDFHGPLVSA